MSYIVHLGKYYPPDMGGIESVTASLAQGAAAAGHAVTVVCFNREKTFPDTPSDGVLVRRAPINLQKAAQPLSWRYLQWAIREGRRAHVVHLHAPNMLAAFAGVFLGRRPKLVVHWHSDVVGKGWLGRIVQPLEIALLRRADRIICTSEAYVEGSRSIRSFRDKVVVIPIGVADHITEHTGSLPAALQARIIGRKVILSVGRLVHYKGFRVLVEAAKDLPVDTVVVIVGTGPLHAALQTQIDAAGMTDKVLLAGRQSNASLRTLFQQAALFCLPSRERSEAFGVVLIEAMSYGLPVVTTKIPGSGVPWVNAHQVSGLNVPVDDADGLAKACNQILACDELRTRLADGARKRFESEFTEQCAIDRILAVYRSLMDEKKMTKMSAVELP